MISLFAMPLAESAVKRRPLKIDEQLILKTGRGDEKAFEELYLETKKSVFGYILSILKNLHDSEDALQDTYLQIRCAARSYEPQGKPLSWIFTIAKHVCFMKLRKTHNHPEIDIENIENSSEYSSEDTTNTVDHITLKAVLELLTEEERKIVILHAVTGIKHREIASLLDMPLATVLSKYKRSLAKLKQYLGGTL